MIKQPDGTVFFLSAQQRKPSPFDVAGMDALLSTHDIVEAVRVSRQRVAQGVPKITVKSKYTVQFLSVIASIWT